MANNADSTTSGGDIPVIAHDAVVQLIALSDELNPEIAKLASTEAALELVTGRSLTLVEGAEHAAITRAREGGFESVAPTSELACQVDAIQYKLGSGPCVDAALDSAIYRTGDLRSDARWPDFGKRAAEETGVLSMLAFRMFFEDEEYIAALNLYSMKPDAFSDEDRFTGLVVATYGALAVTSARRQERVTNLERALETNRDIGVGIGVLMGLHRITREQAFDLLRMASQARHRKLRDLARDVADTGVLDFD